MRVDTRRALAWLFSLAGLAAVTIGGRAMQLNANTVGFVFLIIVLFASVRGGLLVGTVRSIIATLCYNYFFFPPLGTFAIHDPANWVTIGGRAMQLNANTVGFVFLIIVLFASVRGGLLVGTVSSIIATLCYNYFFFPPLGTFAL